MNEDNEKHSLALQKQVDSYFTGFRPISLRRLLFVLGGSLALVLAFLGIFLPGLPCTPFALLSAALFAKSSDRLYRFLLNSKLFGARIRNYQRRKGITRSGKLKIIAFMSVMVLSSVFLFLPTLWLQIVVLLSGLIGSIVVYFVVPTAQLED